MKKEYEKVKASKEPLKENWKNEIAKKEEKYENFPEVLSPVK